MKVNKIKYAIELKLNISKDYSILTTYSVISKKFED